MELYCIFFNLSSYFNFLNPNIWFWKTEGYCSMSKGTISWRMISGDGVWG